MKTEGFFVIHTNLSSAHICRHGQWTTKLLLFSNSLHFHPSIRRSNKYSQVFSLTLSWIFICSRKSSLKKSRFFKHLCFCVPCLTVGAVPLLKLLRKRESVNLKVLYFVGSDLPAVLTGEKQKKKQFLLVSRQVLSFKKNSRKTKKLIQFSSECSGDFRLVASVYTAGDSQQQLSGAIQFYHFPNHVSCQIQSEKRLKRLLLSKWFFRCIPSAFPLRIWRQWKFEEMK